MNNIKPLHNTDSFELKMLELENKTRIARNNALVSARTRRNQLLEQRHAERVQPILDRIETIAETEDLTRTVIKKSKFISTIVGFFFEL